MHIADKTYTAVSSKTVAFLGLGAMGAPMAAHLLRAGHHVSVYNRSPEKAAQWLTQFGAGNSNAAVASSPKEAAQAQGGADIVFSCVGRDDDVRAVCLGPNGAFSGMKAGALFVDHTTTSAELPRELAKIALDEGLGYIDAPVSGGEAGAQNGALTIMCGGDAAHFASIAPVASAYARAITHMGLAGSGQLAKMVNQICIAGLLQALSEALAFGQRTGLNMEQVLDVISKGAAQSWQMENRGKTMLAEKFDFGFAVDWMRKDLGLVLNEAKRNGARLPVTETVNRFYDELSLAGGGRLDTSSLIKRL